MSLSSVAASHKMAKLRAMPVAALPESAESALSSLSRLGQNALNLTQAAKHGSKRHSVFLRAAKPLLQHPAAESPAAQQRKREAPRVDHAAALIEEEALGGSALASMDNLVPHFAKDVGLETPQDSRPPLGAPPHGANGESTSFWTLDWSTALEAVENVLTFAQGFNISFLPAADDVDQSPLNTSSTKAPSPNNSPTSSRSSVLFPLVDQQQQRPPPNAPSRSFSKAGPSTASSQRREALRAELDALEMMLRPKCPWPRQETSGKYTQHPEAPMAFLEEAPASKDLVKQPMVAGPRCAWPREAGQLRTRESISSPSLPAELGPRCAWPKASTKTALSTSPEDLLHPRCSWPRTATSSPSKESSAALSAMKDLASVVLVAAVMADAPRCAWPREKRAPLATSAAVSLAGDLIVTAPRCAWPRQTTATGSSSPVAGPRCAWPKVAAFQPAQAASAITTLDAVEGPRCAWPRSVKGVQPEEVPVPMGPRCAWPRVTAAGKSLGAEMRDAAVEFGFGHARIPVGPLDAAVSVQLAARCGWPRPSRAEPPAPSASLGPRSAWPRAATSASSLSQSMAAAVAPAAVPGPRCAWPKLGSLPAPAPVAEPAVLGPRCAWPKAASNPVAAAESPAAETVEGPRCAWPRKQATLASAGAVAEAEVNTVMGPRCPWPRTGSLPAAAEPNVPQSSGAAEPSAAEEAVWELLPEVAGAGANRKLPQFTAGALGKPAEKGFPTMGARCPWPRTRPGDTGAPGLQA